MNTIIKISNLDAYIEDFNVLNFVESLKIIPDCWTISGNNRKRTATFFTSQSYSNLFKSDGYLILENFLNHEQLGESSTSEEYVSKEEIENHRISNYDWANSKKIQGEMSYNILINYSKCKHKSILTSINYLSELELKYLNDLLIIKTRDLTYNENKFSTIHKNNIIYFELNPILNIITYNLIKDLKIIIKNKFDENIQYNCSDFLSLYKKSKTKCENTNNLSEDELYILTEIKDEDVSEIDFSLSFYMSRCIGKKNRPGFFAENKILLKLIKLNLLNKIKFNVVSSILENNTKWFTDQKLIEFLEIENYNVDGWNTHLL